MRSSEVEEVEEALYVWFIQNRIAGNPISGPTIREKALYFNMMLNGNPNFMASQGWLGSFKKRHGICAHEIHGEKLSADQSSSNDFRVELKNFLIEGGCEDDFVYNADETGLNWKALPTKSLIARWEECAPGYKRRKERVTLMLCANSSGTHRLPLFVVGKSKKPRSFKNVKVPVRYGYQKHAWMNCHVFKVWFKETFIPEVKRYQSSIGRTGKVLLLIDNAPAHPSVQYLSAVDGLVTVKFFPPNVTPLIQPMDQGMIASFKRNYRKQLLRHLLLPEDNTVETVTNFYKKISLKDRCHMAAVSWESVKQITLRNAWDRILVGRASSGDPTDNDADKEMEEIMGALRDTSICNECDKPDVDKWLACDSEDQGFQIMNDEEIIEFISKQPPGTKEEEDKQGDEEESEQTAFPSHSEAFRYLEGALRWYERQDECDSRQLLCLKNIRDLAAAKRRTSLKQTLMTDFLKKI